MGGWLGGQTSPAASRISPSPVYLEREQLTLFVCSSNSSPGGTSSLCHSPSLRAPVACLPLPYDRYVFALFCGLVPVSWMDSFLSISPWGDMHQQNKITDRVWSHQTVPQKKGKTATSSIPTVAKGESSPESCAESAAPADTLTI